jgi:hypothetical protein
MVEFCAGSNACGVGGYPHRPGGSYLATATAGLFRIYEKCAISFASVCLVDDICMAMGCKAVNPMPFTQVIAFFYPFYLQNLDFLNHKKIHGEWS